jgi:hypothetical protein
MIFFSSELWQVKKGARPDDKSADPLKTEDIQSKQFLENIKNLVAYRLYSLFPKQK